MRKQHDEQYDEARRKFLLYSLNAGIFTIGSTLIPTSVYADPLGKVPKMLPATQSIYDFEGDVKVNGIPVTDKTLIKANDNIQTGKDGKVIFAVGKDAFLLKNNTDLTLSGQGLLVQTLRLTAGALLSVFGKSNIYRTINTDTSVIGIRGTGIYIESEPDLSYICTCYGATEIASSQDPNVKELIVSVHHDAPRYILSKKNNNQLIQPAPFKSHTDLELTLIETLVGRVPPFTIFDSGYGTPRRY